MHKKIKNMHRKISIAEIIDVKHLGIGISVIMIHSWEISKRHIVVTIVKFDGTLRKYGRRK